MSWTADVYKKLAAKSCYRSTGRSLWQQGFINQHDKHQILHTEKNFWLV